jgi:hypothetical protein
MWDPGETSDESLSGSVHYLIRPADPTRPWKSVRLHHEPTVHRMHWIRTGATYQLVVLPLHGRGNENGTGKAVKIFAYEIPDDPEGDPWKLSLLDSSLHMTHNFDVINENGREALLVGGKEGAIIIRYNNGNWKKAEWLYTDSGFGEVRGGNGFLSGIQPMHGNVLAVYTGTGKRIVLSSSLNQGHALAVADLLSLGNEQVVAGWREKNNGDEMGIKLFIPSGDDWSGWEERWIDRNGMACEDLKLADLDQNGKMDVIASGRSTHNLVIYWNRN